MSVSAETAVAVSGRLQRRAALASVLVAGTLIAFKVFAYLYTGSVAMMSSLVDSGLDIFASMLNLIAVRHALSPPDEEHRYGHGKAEALAGLGQAAFVSGSAVFLFVEAGSRLVNPVPVAQTQLGIAVMLLSMVLTLGLVLYQRHVADRTGSLAIAADSLHYLTDLLSNAGVIVALVLSTQLGLLWADPVLAILIGLYVLHSAWEIGSGAWDQLMDRELPDAQREQIVSVAKSVEGVRGLHDLRTRAAGHLQFVQMHVEIDGSLSLHEAHAIADRVEHRVAEALPNAEVIVHEDPV